MNTFKTLRDRLEKRAHYRRTVRELREMKDVVARDLGIDRRDAHSIARTVVYGA